MDSSKSAPARRLQQTLRLTSKQQTRRQNVTTTEPSSSSANRDKFVTDAARPCNSEDVQYPLTREEALEFVIHTLHIKDPEAAMLENSLALLNNIIDQINKVIPFTNIHFFSSLPVWNCTPDIQKHHMLSRQGGTCIWVNPFTKAILDRLGYKTYHICGYNPGDGTNDTHISIIVEDVTHPGSRHLVDPGTRRPLCAAIPLDFDKESPIYKFHYMRSKFFRDGDFMTWCAQTPMNTGSKQVMYDSEGQKWHKQVNFWLTEKRHWYPFVDTWKMFFQVCNVHKAPPFNGLIFFAYLDDKIVSVLALGGNFITYFLEEDSYEKVEMTKPQLLELLQTNFPQYSESKLQEVFENYPLS